MKIRDFKPFSKNTLLGFFSLEFTNRLIIKDCTLHEKNGVQWISFPGVPYQKDGVTNYRNIIFFEDRERMEGLKRKILPLLAEIRHSQPPESIAPQDNLPF